MANYQLESSILSLAETEPMPPILGRNDIEAVGRVLFNLPFH